MLSFLDVTRHHRLQVELEHANVELETASRSSSRRLPAVNRRGREMACAVRVTPLATRNGGRPLGAIVLMAAGAG